MKDNSRLKTITLKDFFTLFYTRIWLLILVPAVCMGIVYAQQHFFFEPEYKSTATLYILKQENGAGYNYTDSDFSLALDVVNDCTYILKSNVVLDQVISSLNLDMSYDELYDCIETENPSDTRILEVSATTHSASLSKKIADEVCVIGMKEIADAMGFEQVNLYAKGIEPSQPSNKWGMAGYLLIGIIAAVATYSIILIIYVLDDCIRTKDDIEAYLGVSILGEIPNFNDENKQYGYYPSAAHEKQRAKRKKKGQDRHAGNQIKITWGR